MLRHDGLLGPVTLVARGRDLRTDQDGRPVEVDAARIQALVTFRDRVIEQLELDPPVPATAALVGVSMRSGFRRRIEELLPGRRGDVVHQLLDDLPTGMLVGGVAVHVAGVLPQKADAARFPVDLCAGYAADGTLQELLTTTGMPRNLPRQAAPPLPATDDPDSWHRLDPLPPHSVRRVRRIDVWHESGSPAGIEAFFRDSHTDEDGTESVVHEYVVRAALDVGTGAFTACEADYGALPWPECPAALASAGRLVGTTAADLRERVRTEFSGPTTCTHLNDTLRSLEPVPALLDLLAADHPRTS
ncbi:MAG TPA: DUF2889 domain-containing protein [Nocardioides sp.]|nr:DUF2889 domain-containing protein [Nocardioides sp.]